MNDVVQYKRPSLAEVAAANVDVESINRTADRIANAWYKSVESILDTVRELDAALEKYGNDQSSLSQLKQALKDRGIGDATLSKLKKIGENLSLFNDDKIRYLPPSYNALYEMCGEKLRPSFNKIVKKLEMGGEYEDIKREILTNKSKGGKVQQNSYEPILSLEVKKSKLDDATRTKIRNFINAMNKDPKVTKVKVSRVWDDIVEEA
jgi:hypothetical protein